MWFLASTPGDRYAAAHEHFGSAGMDIKKIILVAVLIGIVAFLVYYAMKDNDKNDQ